ncbi:Tetratricopeptide repeat-containing protein [Oryzisolibacter propanilivorax]|uniref:Tetratricopeptide repeat-containing protein n=1 Tax=Oryzisolibacter propanilivorax TaxID=1527607 RepID=A0A1G9RB65_9BURK|nr:tetratricopeptide repeat protein [Oryzisolibacter propanilivorax]SDM20506.1 Tetratricopeptide repeat-containing protein [Oryzisolibacter propanilivorax]
MVFLLRPPRTVAAISLLAGCVLSTAFAQPVPPPDGTPATLPEVEESEPVGSDRDAALSAEMFYELLMSELTSSNGDPATGYALMLDAARRSNDPRLYRRASELALQSRSAESALIAIRAWNAAYPQSRDANRYLLYVLVTLNRVNESAGPLKREISGGSTRNKISAIRALPQLYARVSNKASAARVVEQALQEELRHPAVGSVAWTTIGRMRLAAQDAPGALAAARAALELDHTDDGAAALALQLMEDGTPEAQALLEPYFAATPLPELRLAYARVLLEAQRLDEAQAQVEALTREQPQAPEPWLLQASLKLQAGELDAAQQAAERFVELLQGAPESEARERALAQAWLVLAQIAEKRGDLAQAESWLARIGAGADLLGVQLRRASLLARQGKLSQARGLIRATPAKTPEEERLRWQAEAQLLRDAGDYRQALEIHGKALAMAPQDDDLAYDQAMLAEKAGQLSEAERLLRGIIARSPQHHHALNALGYLLADRGERLEEARQLITRALELSPDDPFITDSLGWVEFRMGRRQQALELLQRAFKIQPDAEIAAHLGEVLWTLGRRSQALEVWRKALDLSPDNEALRATLKRLGARP